MNIRNLCLLLVLLPTLAAAQHPLHPNDAATQREQALSLLDQRHHYGAASPALRTASEARLPEAEQLMADYWLLQPGTADRMAHWLLLHPVHPLAQRIALMRASLLVREGRDHEALSIVGATPMDNLPADELAEARLYEGIASIHTGQAERARQVLESIQDSERHGMDVQYYLGYVHYMQGRYREAIPCLTAASASYDYRRSAPVLLADCQVQTGQPGDALQTIGQWRRLTGATMLAAEADRVEGEALYGLGRYAEAIAPLQHYVQSASQPSRTAFYKLGMSQLQVEQYDPAALHLSRSAGTERDAMAQNAWLHAGIAYIRTAQKQRARMAFEQASEMTFDPKAEEEALYNYALTLHDGATDGFGESVGVFERFLNTFPQSKYQTSVTQHLAEVYLSTRNYEAALTSINKLRQPSAQMLDVKRQVLYNLGAQRYADGDYRAAKDYLSQSIAIRPANEARYWRGEAEYRLGEYALAAADLEQGVNSDYRNPSIYGLGYALFKQKRYADALPWFLQFANTTAEAPLRADALCRMADCQYSARLYDAALQTYQRAIDTDASCGDYALLQQAFIQGLKGNYSRKAELLSQFENRYADSPYGADALFEKGRAYVQSGQRTQAQQTFTTLLTRYPQSQHARRASNELALIYNETGHTQEAIAAYRKVLDTWPNTAEAQTALSNLKDIYTAQGRINEYAELARQAGKALTPAEIDAMTADAALRATSNGQHAQALAHYKQLEAQTLSPETRTTALVGQLHAAQGMNDASIIAETATRLLRSGRISADIASEARLQRALAYMALGDTKQGVADLQELSQDRRTVYGAQATVELAQYAYNTQQYQSAEQVLSPFIDSGTPHSYWLARAFVLLSDVCAKTGRDVEARQYLLSLKSNYTESEEINQMIQQRLSKLK